MSNVRIIKVDSPETRLQRCFINLTSLDSSTYPAVTSRDITYPDTAWGTNTPGLTSYYVYDQYALRTYNVSP